MEEGTADEIARLGWLSRVEQVGKELRFHYTFEADVPPITNAQIYELSDDLQIADWEFYRNHWAVKNVDLGCILLKSQFGPTGSKLQMWPRFRTFVNTYLKLSLLPRRNG